MRRLYQVCEGLAQSDASRSKQWDIVITLYHQTNADVHLI